MESFQDAFTSGSLTSGTASKIHGMMNFLEQGIYGRIGCSGLQVIKARQQEAARRHLSPAIHESLTLIRTVLQLRRARVTEVIHPSVQRFVVASDAALETPFEGTGGFLILSGSMVQENVAKLSLLISPAHFIACSPPVNERLHSLS